MGGDYYYSTKNIHPILFFTGIAGGIIMSYKTICEVYENSINWYNKKTDKKEDHQTKLIKLIENATEQLNNNTKLINKILESKIVLNEQNIVNNNN